MGANDSGGAQVKFFGDHDGSWTRALGMEVDLSGALLGLRSQRYSLYIDNGLIIKVVPCSPLFTRHRGPRFSRSDRRSPYGRRRLCT